MRNEETKKIFNELLSKDNGAVWREKVAYRKANKSWLNKSAKIAIKVTRSLRAQKMTQASLAQKLGVSPQQVNKILKGRENLGLETIAKLEDALGIELITVLKQDERVVKNNFNALVLLASEALIKEYDKSDVLMQYREVKADISVTFTGSASVQKHEFTSVLPKKMNKKPVEESASVAA